MDSKYVAITGSVNPEHVITLWMVCLHVVAFVRFLVNEWDFLVSSLHEFVMHCFSYVFVNFFICFVINGIRRLMNFIAMGRMGAGAGVGVGMLRGRAT